MDIRIENLTEEEVQDIVAYILDKQDEGEMESVQVVRL